MMENVGQKNTLYPDPLLPFESERKKRESLRTAARAVAPFLITRSKPYVIEQENKQFEVYTQQKPKLLLQDLTNVLSDGIDVRTVLLETAEVLKTATNSVLATVYQVDPSVDEIYQLTPNFENSVNRVSYKIATGTTVAAHCAAEKEHVKLDDLIEDTRFPKGLGHASVLVKAVMCGAVVTSQNDCLAVFEMYRELEDPSYEEHDLRLLIVMCNWIGCAIYQNQKRVTLEKQHELNNYLLNLVKCYFADTLILDRLVAEIINFAKSTLLAEHGVFYIMKPGHEELYADYYVEGIEESNTFYKKNVKIKLGEDASLITLVAQKGNMVNIRNAYQDPRITQDKRRGYIIRSTLCMPITGVDEILGVIQVMNKKGGECFTQNDEILFKTFAVYCAFILSYTRLHQKMKNTHNLNNVYLDMISHHMQPCIHDYTFLITHPEMSNLPPRFNNFDFYIPETYEHYMPQLVMYMFNELAKDMFPNIVMMVKFVLIIKNSYQDLPYHNFHHGFNVCHCMYNILRKNVEFFSAIEIKALLIAAYCHDINHYGFTNNFLQISNHYLAQLYEDSPREYHHYHATMFIIKHLQIFQTMSKDEYRILVNEIRFAILATDITTYFKRRGKLYKICMEGTFNWKEDKHRQLLKSIMMNTADMSGLCKPFVTVKKITDNLYQEFYIEGDKEKEMGLCPLSVMDRGRKDKMPEDQIQLLALILLPCTLILTKIFPNCATLYKEATKLRDAWQEVLDAAGQKLWVPGNSLQQINTNE